MLIKSIVKKIIPQKYIFQAHNVYCKYKSVWYAGSDRLCPFCNGSFRMFLPFGEDELRPDAQCPRCGSLERHRLLWLYLQDKTNFFKNKLKVLDIAPMDIFQQKCKALPNLDYMSADLSSSLAMVNMDITDIKLPDNSFDCIICYHVLEHIIDDAKAMKELFRVLKPGGWALLQSPVDYQRTHTFEDKNIIAPHDRMRVFGHQDHVRIYGQDYQDRLEKAGFTVQLDDYVQKLEDGTIKKYGLMKDEIIYFCTKTVELCA